MIKWKKYAFNFLVYLTCQILQVLNAAMLYWPMPNALYVEGYALDRFAEGSWALQPVHQNRVGLKYNIFDLCCIEHLRKEKKTEKPNRTKPHLKKLSFM